MDKTIQLLAPGGDVDSIKAAVEAGANAIYCGLIKFNARNRATNIPFEELNGILRFAHQHDCKVYVTLNIMILESDLPELMGLLNKLANTTIDGVIVQDLGLFYLLSKYYSGLRIHASTQLTTHNAGQIAFLSLLTATRVNLSRELNIDEIRDLTRISHERNLSTEVFVHGSYCISFSGFCYMSSVLGANSGNRGRCSQPCRDRYTATSQGVSFPLNLKDNSAFRDLQILSDAGVDAFKIEGRMKKPHYVYTVTKAWSRHLQNLYNDRDLETSSSDLHKVFNRDFSDSYLRGDIHKSMFSDHPRNQSAKQLHEQDGRATTGDTRQDRESSYEKIAKNRASIHEAIDQVHIAKAPLTIRICGTLNAPLEVRVQTPETSFSVLSEVLLTPQNPPGSTQHLSREMFADRLKGINNSEYTIAELELDNLEPDLFLPFKEITSIRKRILFILRGSKNPVDPIAVPLLVRDHSTQASPTLSVLISSREDLSLCEGSDAEFHFQLPSRLGDRLGDLIELFATHKRLIPWFPSVLIGEDYATAVEFLRQAHPRRLVTNNTGIAYEALMASIPWIAGPHLNIANSFSLLCLQEKFKCHGSFISNELRQNQIRRITSPPDFKLYYSLFHPIVLMTSRQCLFHQVTGCEKSSVDAGCLDQCEKSAFIENAKKVQLTIQKTQGNYAGVYHETHFLNPDIVKDSPNRFAGFSIDLSELSNATQTALNKLELITLFQNLIHGNEGSASDLKKAIHPTTNTQYSKGI